jgi:hypothetical protein
VTDLDPVAAPRLRRRSEILAARRARRSKNVSFRRIWLSGVAGIAAGFLSAGSFDAIARWMEPVRGAVCFFAPNRDSYMLNIEPDDTGARFDVEPLLSTQDGQSFYMPVQASAPPWRDLTIHRDFHVSPVTIRITTRERLQLSIDVETRTVTLFDDKGEIRERRTLGSAER